MATKVNNSNTTVRNKVTSSCSSSGITHKPTNTRPATASSIDKLRNSVNKLTTTTAISVDKLRTTPTTTSSSGGKPLPNYLKPTCSSRISSVPVKTLTKKTIKEDANQKNLLRRRSFDRLPSNNPPDPKERVVSSERKLGTRSSSFSSRNPVAKPSSEKNYRSCEPMKSQATGTIKRSSSFTRISNLSKNGVCSDSSKLPIMNPHDKTRNLDIESKHESDKESCAQEAEEIQNIFEVQVQSDMQKPEEAEAVQESQIQEHEDANVKPREISIVAEEPNLLLKEIHVDNNDIELLEEEEEEEKKCEEEENQIEKESTSEEGNIDNKKIEEENEKLIEKEVSCEEAAEEKKISEESEEDVVMVEEGNEEKGTDNEVQKRQGGQGKKEIPAAYNDVIEETKNKLLEKRKNKVKALVGAFETVIDYETAGSNK